MPTTKATKSKIADLLTQLDDAFEQAEETREALAKVSAAAAHEVSEAQKSFDAVKAEQGKNIQAATAAADAAKAKLDEVSKAVNARLGQPSDPRVSVR